MVSNMDKQITLLTEMVNVLSTLSTRLLAAEKEIAELKRKISST